MIPSMLFLSTELKVFPQMEEYPLFLSSSQCYATTFSRLNPHRHPPQPYHLRRYHRLRGESYWVLLTPNKTFRQPSVRRQSRTSLSLPPLVHVSETVVNSSSQEGRVRSSWVSVDTTTSMYPEFCGH